jgi:DNA mismatch endonuclease, patch repair protein
MWAADDAEVMRDPLSQVERSELMSRVRQTGTTPELRVRRALSKLGGRYRLRSKELKRRPDIVFPGAKVAVYVHGCFWHQHSGCAAARIPRTRPDYWKPKLAANVERDARHARALEDAGWLVVTIWECETKSPALEDLLRPVVELVQNRQRSPHCSRVAGPTRMAGRSASRRRS